MPDAPGKVTELLNQYTESAIKSRYITARTVLSSCVNGATILDKLEAAAANSTPVKWALKFIADSAGLDVGHPATQSMIDQLVTGSVLTVDEGNSLKTLAMQPASRAEVLGFGRVTEEDLRIALGT